MPTAARAALLNLLHGLLLGLYPYNLRQMTFAHRVRVAGAVRALLTGTPSEQRAFIAAHESLLTFAMIEYLANVVPDFCPVEEALLIRSVQCRYSLNQVCEAWRLAAMDRIPTRRGGADAPMWTALDDLASSHLPVLLRQLKANNHKACKRPKPPRLSPALWAVIADNSFFDRLMAMPHIPITPCNMIAQVRAVAPSMPFEQLQAVEFFWNAVFVCQLPANILAQQEEALTRIGSCAILQRSYTLAHVCLRCALRSKTTIADQKFAHNCVTRALLCAACSRPVTAIHLLGRLLRIKDTSYFLCPSCLRLTVWDGVGNFTSCSRCRAPPPPPRAATLCHACDHKAVYAVRGVLDTNRLEVVSLPLCSRHAKSCVLSRSTVYDLPMLERDLWRRGGGCV
jgi:hypothetical protein